MTIKEAKKIKEIYPRVTDIFFHIKEVPCDYCGEWNKIMFEIDGRPEHVCVTCIKELND